MRLGRVVLCLAFSCFPAFSSSYFEFSGHFNQDDDKGIYTFTINFSTSVYLQSWSYAGGTDALSTVVPAGGFAPVLSLFDSTGALLGFDAGGNAPSACDLRNIDTDGLCLDAELLEPSLNAGTYTVVLTEQDNTPNGPTFADGFLQDGAGNFTGPEFLGTTGSFIDQGLNQRNSSYLFTIGPVNSAVAVPEPSTALLLLPGMLFLWRRKGQKTSRRAQ